MEKQRCEWPGTDPLMQAYHDNEWGVPVHDDHKHFEYLLLDSFQAGLSWAIILKKRENFRTAFDNFDFEKIAGYGPEKVEKLVQDAGIIRNRAKILATIGNARAFIEIRKEFGSFDKYIWSFVDHKPIINHYKNLSELPASTEVSDKMSKDLKKRGFKFAGSTICYAYMQGAGLVNDHIVTCFLHKEISGMQ